MKPGNRNILQYQCGQFRSPHNEKRASNLQFMTTRLFHFNIQFIALVRSQ